MKVFVCDDDLGDIARLKTLVGKYAGISNLECMDDLCNELQRRSKTIHFDCVEGNIQLKASEIILIETEGHKCLIRLKDRTYQIYEKLEEIEKCLKMLGFLMTHKSFLVNMEHIRNINSYILTLDNNRQISVPKARYKQVKQEYTLYKGKK